MVEAFRLIPYGIYLLTTRRGKDLLTMVVSWVSQVSFSPPMLMVALRRNREALPAIQESGFFSLSLLKSDQKPLVSRFKDSPAELVSSSFFAEGTQPTVPFLKRCLASFECRLVSTVVTGDHLLCIAEVQSALAQGEGDPLTTVNYGKTYIGQF